MSKAQEEQSPNQIPGPAFECDNQNVKLVSIYFCLKIKIVSPCL